MCYYFPQAAELAEFTAKIALLEDAKRKKEEEATEWQHKVMPVFVCLCVCVVVITLSKYACIFFPGSVSTRGPGEDQGRT